MHDVTLVGGQMKMASAAGLCHAHSKAVCGAQRPCRSDLLCTLQRAL
jgi:hypothetical protein